MFTIRLAGQTFTIENQYDRIQTMCRDYFCEGTGIPISVSEEEIRREQTGSTEYPLSYLETLAVYRKIADHALMQDILLFHGSAIAVDGGGYLFTAVSGTGKSTHTRLWREYFTSRATMINDDKPLLRFTGDRIYVCGTPWDGKHHLSTNTEVPLRAICVLERGETNRIEPISFRDAYPFLLQQSFRSSSPAGLIRRLELIDRMRGKTGLYRLACNMDIEAAETAYKGMQAETNSDI